MLQVEILENGDMRLYAPIEWCRGLERATSILHENMRVYAPELVIEALVNDLEYRYFGSNDDLFYYSDMKFSLGLTSAPVIMEEKYNEETDETDFNNSEYWVFGSYMLRSELDDLARKGEVIFTHVKAEDVE